LEELVDVAEVILGLVEVDGGTPEQLERKRQAKAAERGAFHRRVFLIDADD
jgi:predicted house-cleaning noncanonical NTP pyrophosphatase (MazG superfamily)